MKPATTAFQAARFLRLLSDKDLQRIFVYSTHRNHQGRTLDIYS